ncbi:hypothetical protein [Burkholderia pyrrocinia]|uniref:Uncharacterized protein n=1 Tax=Burkholderia pyrrocinia TaxID=60550 RepID=A0ABZ3BIF3_BURPY
MEKISKTKQEMLRLLGALNNIEKIFERLHAGDARLLKKGMDAARRECECYINGEKVNFKPSDLIAGFKQAIRETPFMFRAQSLETRKSLMNEHIKAVESEIPGFFDKESEKIQKIIKRGKIRNPDDFYLAELCFEQMHEANPDGEDSVALRRIMDDFEFGSR